ncbi:methenyltetrahydrofolate synthase domain-containing protein isoform X4 [Echinops telfairi]|uniref:Methenyltetrahydrofolate synthase domain-containing protein n=1 Tax=Echinops telfairi TaxID=9371 RepID=A0ABM0IPK2_ECHTE|nr:methenyltetrahydrofolate synthase domain-containing protein isoform X4 [Echinops telfairi]
MELKAGATKQDIREQIWDYMESKNLADFPRPVHHRIPNFKGAPRAAEHLPRLQEFSVARTVKVNPDAPQRNARFAVLESRKTLLVPTPRLRTGLFNRIVPPPGAGKDVLRACATAQGVRNYSVPIGLDASVLVDMVVVGSVAVSEQGWRLGKGEGYADLEYAMMVAMGAVREETPVVTIVHDCQVVPIPEALLEEHDLTVDYVLTPTRVIRTGCQRPKPRGITWSKISPEMLRRIPVLRDLRRQEQQAGKDVALRGELLHPCATTPSRLHGAGCPPTTTATVHVGGLPAGARVGELKRALREHGAAPLRLAWQGPGPPAVLSYRDQASAERAVACLQALHLGTSRLCVELAEPPGDKGAASLGVLPTLDRPQQAHDWPREPPEGCSLE